MTSSNSISIAQNGKSTWLAILRLGWIGVLLLTSGLFIAGIPIRFANLTETADTRSLLDLSISLSGYATYLILLDLILIIVHDLIAAVIFWRRTNDWLAMFVAYALVTNGAMIPLSRMYILEDVSLISGLIFAIVAIIALTSSVCLLYLFPDGKFVPRWTRLLAVVWGILVFFAIFFPEFKVSLPTWSPFFQFLTLFVIAITGVFAQVYRYENVSSPLQKQQAKWALLGLIAAVFSPFAYFVPFVIVPSLNALEVPNLIYQRLGSSFFTYSFIAQLTGLTFTAVISLLFPFSFAIAVLRYRLWDIDILINRALVYGLLTGLLALIYFSSVILLQSILRRLTGQGQSEVVTVLSTLAIAALFIPLQRRVQAGIDRRFYRSKYDAAKTLAAFSATLRDEVDLGQLCERLVAVVEQSMHPEYVSLWIKPTIEGNRLIEEKEFESNS